MNSFRLQRSSPNEKKTTQSTTSVPREGGVVMLNGFSGIRRYGV